jgi:catechol 2,3-dioxygenase-like lactoylglutathione lyase family enzyme
VQTEQANQLEYAVVAVPDLERSLDFYCGLLEFKLEGNRVVNERTGARRYRLGSHGRFLELETLPEMPPASEWVEDDLQLGMRHIGMKVDDVDGWAEKLRDAGVRFRVEPTNAFGQVRLCFFLDPDGTNLEFVQGNVRYNKTWSDDLVRQEESRPLPRTPRFDHIAVSVSSLDAAIDLYQGRFGFRVIGQLVRPDEPRGFTITYFEGNTGVVEVFSFSVPVQPNPWSPDEERPGLAHLGLRSPQPASILGSADADGARLLSARASGYPALMMDADGTALEVVGPSTN